MTIEITEFAKRQYAPDYSGPRVTPDDVEKLIELAENPARIIPGYADFCQIIAIDNKLPDGSFRFALKHLSIDRNTAMAAGGKLETAYESRNEDELPVLVEWVSGIDPPTANYIHLIVYDREQLAKEDENIDADWGIVAIATGADLDVEPMRPITMMRNALGIEEGGSGVPLDREAYIASCEYWSKHIMLRDK